MDPYVRLRIGHTIYETQADVRGGKFPNWNKTITSYVYYFKISVKHFILSRK